MSAVAIVSAGGFVLDVIDRLLNVALRYNAIQRQAESEGRAVNMDDVRKLQAELKVNQADLDSLIAAMPDDAPPG